MRDKTHFLYGWNYGLALVLAVAVFFRAYHLGHGLPDLAYVDSFRFVGEANQMVTSGIWWPKDFAYPGLYVNLLAVLYSLFNISSPYACQLVASSISAVAGSALVVSVYYMARLFCSNKGALFASCLSASCITSITYSRAASTDTLMVLFMTLSLYTTLIRPISTKHFVIAGIFSGLSAGTKFTGLYLILWLPLAALIADRPTSVKKVLPHIMGSYLSFAATFLLCTPSFLPLMSSYIHRIVLESKLQQAGMIGAIQGGYFDYLFSFTQTPFQPWLGTSFIVNFGIPLTVAGLVAIFWGFTRRKDLRLVSVVVYIVMFLVLISGPGRQKMFRYVLPVIPLIYVVTGCFLDSILFEPGKRYSTVLSLVIALLLIAMPVIKSVQYIETTFKPTTIEIAKQWLMKNIAPGTKVFRGPFYLSSLQQLPYKFVLLKNVGSRLYGSKNDYANPEISPIYNPKLFDEFRQRGVQYLVMNSYFDDMFSPVPENLAFFPRSINDYQAFVKRLKLETQLVFSVEGLSAHRQGPDIFVYKLADSPRSQLIR
jgi:hypothetical protein